MLVDGDENDLRIILCCVAAEKHDTKQQFAREQLWSPQKKMFWYVNYARKKVCNFLTGH